MRQQRGSPATARSFFRILRKIIDTGLPIVGVVVIFSAVLSVKGSRSQIPIIVLGILLIEAGVWKLAHASLPNERHYLALRAEGDWFITLVRHLNDAALVLKQRDTPENRQAFEEVREAMHQAVDRMAKVAGKTDAELAAERQVTA